MTLQYRLKRAALWLADRTGGLHIVGHLTRRWPRILMYHRFARGERWRCMDVSIFERQMGYLRRHFSIAGMDDIACHLSDGRSLPDRTVVVTVDDAFEDFYTLALPVLRRYAIPATLYVPTDFVDRKEILWPDRIYGLLLKTKAQYTLVPNREGHLSLRALATLNDRRAVWEALADFWIERSAAERNAAIAELALQLGVESEVQLPCDQPMSWEQIQIAADAGITIGSHTCSHVPLARESYEAQLAEARDSKRRIEAMIGRPVRHYCYPHGRAVDYDERSVRSARDAGYETAVAAYADDRPLLSRYDIRRFGIAADNTEFRKIVWGVTLLKARETE